MMRALNVALLSFVCASAFAADKKKTAAPAQDQMAQAQAMMEKAAAPGAEHKLLAKLAGNWTTSAKMFWGPKPMEMNGSAENKMMLGDRYLDEEFKGTFMGKPFEGHGWTGFDNVSKKFVATWVDNMGTGIIFMEGTADGAGKTITFTGTENDPMTGKSKTIREVMTIDSPTQHTDRFFEPGPDGKEMKTMEIVYTKK